MVRGGEELVDVALPVDGSIRAKARGAIANGVAIGNLVVARVLFDVGEVFSGRYVFIPVGMLDDMNPVSDVCPGQLFFYSTHHGC